MNPQNITLIHETDFKEFLFSKNLKRGSVKQIIASVKTLLRKGKLTLKEKEFESWAFFEYKLCTRNMYKRAYRLFHEWSVRE
jgi:hypothetical protein